jgi:cytochrome c2
MPDFKLSMGEINSLVDYLTEMREEGAGKLRGPVIEEQRRESKAPSAESLKADIDRGRQLFMAFGCIGCHMVEGKGGTQGPELTDVFKRKTQDEIFGQIKSPQAVVPGTIMPNMNLGDEDIRSIVTFLSSLVRE